MNRFIKNITFLLIPLIIWGVVVIIVDPYNYFGLGIINNEFKKSADELNELMYTSIDYIHAPSENMLIGDSRTELLPLSIIEKLSNKKYKRVVIHGGKLNEIFDFFYLANNVKPIKSIVIGINFNMFNKYGYEDRVSGIKKVLQNPFMYVYDKDIVEAVFVTLKQMLFKAKLNSTPSMTREEFWKWNIKSKAFDWYGKYDFPDKLYTQLLAFDNFTKKKNIQVIFIIVPHHVEFHQQLVRFGLQNDEIKFKKIMSSLNAKVYDYDFLNSITIDKNNFRDPIHYDDSIGKLIVREIWTNDLRTGKKLN